jgi:uracil-DNA glycosylase family 4
LTATLHRIHEEIVSCTRCDRLREYCARIAHEKKGPYRNDTYWAKPVPGFGDPLARVLVIALAPAAHGANRTGRVFTGDVPGGSGDFLMRAMHAAGFASMPTSRHANDGLELRGAYIMSAVRCAPPDNKPTPAEILTCHPHLVAEAGALPGVKVIVALGRIGFDATWRLLAHGGVVVKPKPAFRHGAVYRAAACPVVVASYHPSRQNTNTGVLTSAMLAAVFRKARKLAELATP